MMNTELIESKIGYEFKDKSLLRRAFTLSSADGVYNNQVLEFFGDAIIEFIVSEKIFLDGGTEGSLTERRKTIVSDNALTPISEGLGLDRFLIRGKSDNFNKKAVPSVYEALTAAIYIDGGMDEAKRFVYSTLNFNGTPTQVNYKGMLQELMQSQGQACPTYTRVDEGNPQAPWFVAKVNILGKTFSGEGESVRSAEQQAAKSAYSYYNELRER
jgi:ribonuclease-3